MSVKNLIFLISQPRAGSTLLQRILGAHPDVHTVSEPWLMLHPLYALRPDGYKAEYEEKLASTALQDFIKTLPSGDDDYVEGLRRMYGYLYTRALKDSGKRHFLDKTPRYYFIVSELYRVFPEAHYIILLRNPLAVLSSILNSWIRKNWFSLYRFKHDFVDAPRFLLDAIKLLGNRCVVVHYEQLVGDPDKEVHRICDKLGIEFVPEMVEYGRQKLSRFNLGDDEEIYRHKRPSSEKIDKWTQSLDDPQVWLLIHDYLNLLGRETIEQMGYSYEELLGKIEAYQPKQSDLRFRVPLELLIKKPEERNLAEYVMARLTTVIYQRGIWGATVAGIRKVINALSKPG